MADDASWINPHLLLLEARIILGKWLEDNAALRFKGCASTNKTSISKSTRTACWNSNKRTEKKWNNRKCNNIKPNKFISMSYLL